MSQNHYQPLGARCRTKLIDDRLVKTLLLAAEAPEIRVGEGPDPVISAGGGGASRIPGVGAYRA
jgi:hypothetical protein